LNRFKEQLAWSAEKSYEGFWNAVYKKAFPNLVKTELCLEDMEAQALGIDRLIHLDNGRIVKVDEKKRSKDYGDILLEYVSNDRTGSPGWVKKNLAIDYIAYAIVPASRCYLFDWLMLRRAWDFYEEVWKEKYETKSARNPNYNTLSLAVPTRVLMNAVAMSSVINVSRETK